MDHLSSLTLDLLELGQLDAASSASAREHLNQCTRCAGDLAVLRDSRARFEADVFARTLPRVERRRSHRLWYWILSPALIAAAAGVVVGARPVSDVTAKGGRPACEVFARRSGRIFVVKDGSALTPGDEIRFVVRPAGYRHVLVASVDSAAVATIYAPYGAERSLQLASATDRAELPGSVRLDTTPGPERLYCLFSQRPIDAAPVLVWLRQIGAGGAEALRNPKAPALSSVVAVSALVEKVVP
jgi:hypothetical protein